MLMFLQRDSDGPVGVVLKYLFMKKMGNGTFVTHYKKSFHWQIGGYL
jgi:hypothetical protein